MERENAEEWDRLLFGKVRFLFLFVFDVFCVCDSYSRRRREITKERRSAEVSVLIQMHNSFCVKRLCQFLLKTCAITSCQKHKFFFNV